MNIKNTTLSFFLLASVHLFSQETVVNKDVVRVETKLSYLDSIKKTFVKDDLASCVDSLWMKELTNLDLYNNLTDDIKNINIDQIVDYELPTALLKERLAAMDAKSPFNIEYNQGLENIIKSFLKNRKKSFERLMGTSEYYFPLFEEALAKQNVPLEIKYLAVVESALNPKAVSKMGATGLWQFMYQTGKQYGLKIDSYVDERSDPLKSSEAAAQYMTNMYKIFGDWDLVLASYNSGPGNVAKAIRRSGGQQNYWNIRKNLPKETQGYVPAFLATMYIYEYHKEHGIVPNRASVKHFATDTIMIKKQMTFKQISDLLDVPVAQLQLLNPSYKLNVIPFYHDQNHYLRLPQEKIAVFASNEAQIYAYTQYDSDKREKPFQIEKALTVKDTANYTIHKISLPKTTYYKVKRGDNLSMIANKYDVDVSDIKKWNKLKSNTVAYGKSLKIVIGTDFTTLKKEPKMELVSSDKNSSNQRIVASEAKANKDEKTKKATQQESIVSITSTLYVVQKGDNLGSIAKKYDVTIAEIQEWNHLTSDNVQLGASLQVVKKESDRKEELVSAPERKDIEYVVLQGDNLGNIAKKFGVSLSDLKQWNNLQNNTIGEGATLIVAKDEIVINTNKATVSSFKKKTTTIESSKKEAINYYVKKGDSLYSISKKYPGVTISDLKKWNGIRNEELKPGMKLKING
ncbi:LysM peptidoglycan-binding domain-containing protein [Flavobacterium glaciei]|uniref:Membrane-bound lytic murein transglycosylase D n=1 Tax=Flavobacterium glaciei TaxID=386300 RepID=A0A562PYE7_9FLAO|nr:LysM peptidoglycan-binding domain-containing protein [Flavobacterium glaciei]RDI56536.1 membrane-bound lytic murein transglycosylase D [Flavobacterium glaciei]TWI49106.1 membrane-bound lytic murein transglycosylase D [Flavobacterium glaciei]